MMRSKGDMASLKCFIFTFAVLHFVALCTAGPLGPLPNVTSSDLGLKEGSCAVGDVVYMPGDEFPGASACERCACASGGVTCSRQRCEPRPGCKALHRPDHCCPTYQCECEQEGRVYGNGEKLVDPADPCRVCYCQGGEVVCRRIACFVRDDCRPRLVPGRCCPEYDNCPLRGVTTIPGAASSVSSIEDAESSPMPVAPKENNNQKITIKEITPVSEIPVITDVKIKEILPSPSIEVTEYSSSKSPLIVREATSEKAASNEDDSYTDTEAPAVVDLHSSPSTISVSSVNPEVIKDEVIKTDDNANDSPPSKISFSTQDSINSEIYPSVVTSVATMGAPSITPEVVHVASTTKAPIVEEEDTSFDHNPAFPPLPDDLSVLRNHEDEMIPEQNLDNEHVSMGHEIIMASASPPTEEVIIREPIMTTAEAIPETPVPTPAVTLGKVLKTSIDFGTTDDLSATDIVSTAKVYSYINDLSTPSNVNDFSAPNEIHSTNQDTTISTKTTSFKESPMLNLRSAIPTEILNVPSSVPEEINGDLDEITEGIILAKESEPIPTSITTESVIYKEDEVTAKSKVPEEFKTQPTTTTTAIPQVTTNSATEAVVTASTSQALQEEEQTTSHIAKSNIATEVTAQTELSSLPIETSDQNPHEISENIAKEKVTSSTIDPVVVASSTKMSLPMETEVITVSRSVPTENQSFENVETTEFILTSFASSETATDAVELIKISAEPEMSADIIEPPAIQGKKGNVLTDLINLVGDVASIGDHTDSPDGPRHAAGSTSISESEELIPVNAGYKSKNSNFNLNSITEIPIKSKSQLPVNKQKIVEIEDEDTDNITDSPPPNDRVEPTTRRPIIDNVSDDKPENKTERVDIEIITKSYVPTLNRRPTKVVMKKSNETPISKEMTTQDAVVSSSAEGATESDVSVSRESATVSQPEISSAEAGKRIAEATTVAQ